MKKLLAAVAACAIVLSVRSEVAIRNGEAIAFAGGGPTISYRCERFAFPREGAVCRVDGSAREAALPAMATGKTTAKTYEQLAPNFPGGMTYAVSADGGENVPMVVPYGSNRRLMMAWIAPFGSYLVIRELVQLDNRELGSKWCPEVMPQVASRKTIPAGAFADREVGDSALYETTVGGAAFDAVPH